jgi:hypothetical protein
MKQAIGASKIQNDLLGKHTRTTTRTKPLAYLYSDWLGSIEWTAFCTFTTLYNLSIKAARRMMERMTENLVARYGKDIRIFWTSEPFFDRHNCYHIHALIKIPVVAKDSKNAILSEWREVTKPVKSGLHNRSEVQNFIPGKGAHIYITKYLDVPNADYGIY